MDYNSLFSLADTIKDSVLSAWSYVLDTMTLTFSDLVDWINSFPGWSISEWLLEWLTTAEFTIVGMTFKLGDVSIFSLCLGAGLVITICVSVVKWIIGIIT